MEISPKLLFNFISKLEVTDNCWNWKGVKIWNGYGRFRLNDKKILAHRFSFMTFKGELIKGFSVDHICRNRACVNPDHLRQISKKDNILCGIGEAAKNAVKTHCKHGHEFNKENTRIVFHKQYKLRQCKQCQKDKNELRQFKITTV